MSGGSVGVILNERDDRSPSVEPSITTEEETPDFSVRIKRQWDDDTLDSCQPSQADWIRQYMEQQEEVISPNSGAKYDSISRLKALSSF